MEEKKEKQVSSAKRKKDKGVRRMASKNGTLVQLLSY
jgi:ribosomal protein L34